MNLVATSAGDILDYALAAFFIASGAGLLYLFVRMGGTFGRLSSFIKGAERDALPVVVKAGGTVDRVNDQLDKLDTVTDSAVVDGRQRRHGGPRGLDRDHDAREEGQRLRFRPVARRVGVSRATRCGRGGSCRQGRGRAARERARRRASQRRPGGVGRPASGRVAASGRLRHRS